MATAERRHILVVEDDVDIRDALVGILRDEGYEVFGAANGQEALDYLNGRERQPALILLDLMMPVMNGWQFRAAQQQRAEIAEVPVVVISADGGVPQKAASLQAVGYLKKPVELDTLLDLVAKYAG